MGAINAWDSGSQYDQGLQFDVNDFPSVGNVQPYVDLITQEHIGQPNFIAALTELLQPLTDNLETLRGMPVSFDLDGAVGAQLDVIGEWVGVSRRLTVPLANVYFSLGVAGLGFGEGVWKGPFDPSSGLISLPDAMYRTLIRSVILANQWDGTIPGAYEIWDALFAGTGLNVFIIDNQDMSMYLGVVGAELDAVTQALLTGGYLDLKPEGVRIAGYYVSTAPAAPVFGFGADNATIGGFGHGSWAKILPPT